MSSPDTSDDTDVEHGVFSPPLPDVPNSTAAAAPVLVMPTWRKYVILLIVSCATLVTTLSSTSLLAATPEIAAEFGTTVEILNVTNACVLIAMGFSSLIWLPLGRLFGRRKAYNAAIFTMFAWSIGAALAPNMAIFTAMRLLCGFTGTYFMVAGQTIIADVFEPTVRGRAVGFFMVGSVAGPALGPCIGGIIVTFTSWRVIYWLQVGMAGLVFALSMLLVPDIPHVVPQEGEVEKGPSLPSTRDIVNLVNPWTVFQQLLVPQVLLTDLTCGTLAMTQYGMLTCVRHVVNPRFNLTTPLVSGLFYISPGVGFFVGSVVGGKLSDRTVKRYIRKRQGLRLPRDRLNSGLGGQFFIMPLASMLYGWSLDRRFGGLALPIVAAFWIGAGLMGTYNAINTFAAEVIPEKRSEVVTSKYIIQYIASATATAIIVPMVDGIGVGPSFCILVGLQFLGGVFVLCIAKAELVSKLLCRRTVQVDLPA